MAADIAWSVAGTLMLVQIYRHVALTWPQSYFGPGQPVVRYFSRTGFRFMLFRFLPPYLVFVVVGVYAQGNQTRVVWLCAGVYALTSSLLSLYSSARGVPDAPPLTAHRVVVLLAIAAGLGGCAWAAIATAPRIEAFAPQPAEVIANLVAAALAAILVVSFVSSTRNSDPPQSTFPADLTKEIEAIAIENCVDPALAVAIGYVESMQRPPWFRQLEQRTSRLRPSGSFGLFQVAGHGPVSDRESCRIALSRISGAFPLLDENRQGVEWSVRQLAEQHNPDARFSDMVYRTYAHMATYPIRYSGNVAPDRRHALDVWSIGRFGDRMRVRGTFWTAGDPATELVVETKTSDSGVPRRAPVRVTEGSTGRSAWFADLPLDAAIATVRVVLPRGRRSLGESLKVDLRDGWLVGRDLTLQDAEMLEATVAPTRGRTQVMGMDINTQNRSRARASAASSGWRRRRQQCR